MSLLPLRRARPLPSVVLVLSLVTSFVAQAAAPAVAMAAKPLPPPPEAPAEPSPADKANRLREQGNEAMLSLHYDDALAAYREALRFTPDAPGLHYSMARAYQLRGEYPAALDEMERFQQAATPEIRAKIGDLDTLVNELRAHVGTLVLGVNMAGARVLVRDHVVGVTPLAPLRLGAGAATVQIELPGFFAEKRDVVLQGSETLKLDVELHPTSTSALLVVSTTPMGAMLFVDGKPSGTTNPRVELAVSGGPHEIRAHRDGYDDARIPLVLQAGATRDLAIPMSRSVPLTSRWWFWTGVGVVVAGGIATGIALTTEKGASHGTLAPGQVGGP